ncbi:TPA: hypothetical protein N0F65_003265 [Lagenidium giganteum]|uniref:Uncharacterized protein n=1 Tax=Lagenidium giganteum TaxID=4803 RepID=A0AAV2YLN6_9STRA|nr:TPA: hypothetical protein N0F65_003265 [Lagenidium giganteum]
MKIAILSTAALLVASTQASSIHVRVHAKEDGYAKLNEVCRDANGGALLCAPGLMCLEDPNAYGIGHCVPGNPKGGVCYKECKEEGTYCAKGTDQCFKPWGNMCLNPATGLFQIDCDPGFVCSNGKCVNAKKHHRGHHHQHRRSGPVPAYGQCYFKDGTELPCMENNMCLPDKNAGMGFCAPGNPNGAVCYKECKDAGTYCAKGSDRCFEPWGSMCLNPATGLFQIGCDPGFKCENYKCCFKNGGALLCEPGTTCLIDKQKKTGWCVPGSANGGNCYKQCKAGEYCAKGSDKCFKPKESICMNPGTGLFQIGCDAGFKCSDGKCVGARKHHHRRHREHDNEDEGAVEFGEQCASPDGGELPCAEGLECFIDDDGIGICDYPLFDAKREHKKHHRGHHHTKSSMPRAAVDEQCQFEDGRKAQCEENHMCIVDKTKKTGYCVPGNPNGANCYIQCKQSGTYCAKGSDRCYEAWGSTCLNPGTGLFQAGCDPGFKCENFKCVGA